MRRRWVALAVLALAVVWPSRQLLAQAQPPSDKLVITGTSAFTWSDGKSDIVQVNGPVTIKLDSVELSARQAIIWLTTVPGTVIEQQKAEIALLGDAKVRQPSGGITRSGPRLLVTADVRGDIRINADERLARDMSDTQSFKRAAELRAGAAGGAGGGASAVPSTAAPQGESSEGGGPVGEVAAPRPPSEVGALQPSSVIPARPNEAAPETKAPAGRGPAKRTGRGGPVRFHADIVNTLPTPDGTIALQLTGGVTLLQTRENDDFIEMTSERAVVFTKEKAGTLKPAGGGTGEKITAAYLEGDVRIDYTPADKTKPEQRLTAERVYYDFDKNQAILTDAILRTNDPLTKIPVTLRARTLRQLAAGEYKGEHVEVSTSSFALPTYSVRTDKIYVHQEQVPSRVAPGETETDTDFVADDDTLRIFGVPAFYLPEISGSIDKDPFPLRSVEISNTNRLGFGVATTFGLFELLGKPRPKDLDLTIQADYYSKRGPATGINGKYSGNNINQDTGGLTDFNGQFKSFLITDHGTDIFPGGRSDVKPPDQLRGKILFEHQQFFPDHWQAQLRLGYVSDPTFLEEYFPQEFYTDQPYNFSAYFKHQVDTEAITLGAVADTNRFVTTSDQIQEQFDVERLPEIGYRRVGDSLAGDKLTFFSENTADRIRFARSRFSPAQQGFVFINPGLPSEGYTGTTSSPNYRGDSRQEVDYPIQLGQVKMVPYVVGRATGYTKTPSGSDRGRLFGAAGVRFTTAFWRIDNSVDSDLLDLHRLRHVLEPEVNLFTSGETLDRSHLYVYDENVDGISDVSAAQLVLHNRFQTYRGGPGKRHSVDFLTVNVSANIFTNPPRDAGVLPTKFRGLYFPSRPETSVPRDSINSDLTWLVSDNTAFLADVEYNTDHAVLATAAAGLAVKRDERLSYYLGIRYIEQLNSDVATFAAQYELTSKYTIDFTQSFDLGVSKDVSSVLGIRRRFDRLTAEVSIVHDDTTGQNGFSFNLYPEGFAPAGSAQALGSVFSNTPQ